MSLPIIETINTNIANLKQTKQDIKNAINIDFNEVANEQINDYADLIIATEEEYKSRAHTENFENSSITINNSAPFELRNSIIKGQTSQATVILPTEYQQVEYIESSGTQYIDSTFKPDENSKIECTLQLTDLYSDSQEGAILFGIASLAGGSANTRIVAGLGLNPIRFYAGLGANNYTQNVSDGNVFFNKMKYFVDLKNNTYGYDNNSYNGTQPVNYRTQNVSAYIFARRGTNGVAERKAKMKLYNCKCYSSNILVNDFIPCYKKSDNEIGLYDIVTNTFLTNAGTGDFTKGNDITSLPTPEFPIPIKNVTGNSNVKIQNKNLLPNNLTWQYGYVDGSGGWARDNTHKNAFSDYIYLKAGTYTISYEIATTIISIAKYNTSKVFIERDQTIYAPNTSKNKTFTLNQDGYIRISHYDNTGSQILDNINTEENQIEIGTTATSYVPHREQNLPFSLKSKNLFDYDTFIANNRNYTFNVIPGNILYRNAQLGSLANWKVYNNNDELIESLAGKFPATGSYTIPANAKYITTTDTGLSSNLYIGYSSDTSFEPYYDIRAMEGTTLEDDGIHNTRKQIILTGTEIWYKNTNYSTESMLVASLSGQATSDIKSGTSNLKCTHFKYANPTVINSFRAMATSLGFGVDATQFEDINAFKNWVATQYNNGTPVTVEYELAEEEIIPYNSTQQAQYNAIKQAKAYYDKTYIAATSDELPPIFSTTACTKEV